MTGRERSVAAPKNDRLSRIHASCGDGPHVPENWRAGLPDPGKYYRERLRKMREPAPSGWAACCCPFHQDKHASASVNLQSGAFRCHACGARGDLVRFHMKFTGLGFKHAVTELLEIKS